MSVEVRPVDGYPRRFFAWERSGDGTEHAQIGVQLPDKGSGIVNLVFFWAGSISISVVGSQLDSIERLAAKEHKFSRKIVAYGSTKAEKTPTSDQQLLSALLDFEIPPSQFQIYRAEIKSAKGNLAFWANISVPWKASLEQGGENISIAFAPSILPQGGKDLIRTSVHATKLEAVQPMAELMTVVTRQLGG